MQQLSFLWGIYVILPIALLYKSHAVLQFIRQHWKKTNIIYSLYAALGIEMLVLSFFYRVVLTILIVGLVVFKGTDDEDEFSNYLMHIRTLSVIINRMKTNRRWLVSSLVLAVFPSLPVIEKDANNPLLL